MGKEPQRGRRRPWLVAIAGIAVVAACASTAWGRGLCAAFFASLRIAKPTPVTATVSAPAGTPGSRQLQGIIGSMVADSAHVTLDEPDRPAPDVAAAAGLTSFPVLLPRTRTDKATLTVVGAHDVTMIVHRSQLQAILAEAGEARTEVPASLDGATVVLHTPRAIRAEFGHCPAPVANTLQNQVQGPPPASAENNDCIVLMETQSVVADVPPALDMEQLVGIGLQVSGMSPDQARSFQKLFNWRSTLSLTLPRSMRSSQVVDVNGVPGVLFTTGSRRGPAYALMWSRNGVVCVLTSYGSSADAVAIANATN